MPQSTVFSSAGSGAGIIPFGSTDPSVILQCSLKSQAEVVAVGGSVPNAGTIDYDTTLGAAANATNGGIRFTTPTGYADLDIAGQVSFEVETRGISVNNSAIYSQGNDLSGNNYVMVLRPAAATTNYMRLYLDGNERPQITWQTAGASTSTSPGAGPVELTTLGKNQFTTITISWVGNSYDFYVDGNWLYRGSRSKYPAANIGERIEIMSGAGLGNCITGVYARNLIVSKRPVMVPTHPVLNKVAFVGHSYTLRAAMWAYTNTWRDQSIGLVFRRRLLASGIGCNLPNDGSTLFASPGATILNSGGTPIEPQVTLCAAINPSCIIYQGGINDVANASYLSVNRAQTLTDLKAHITTLMAGKNAKLLILVNVNTTIADSSSYAVANNDKNVEVINYDFSTIPAWWDATNPSRAGQVVVADGWNAFNRSNPNPRAFNGTIDGGYDDLHTTAFGNVILGNLIADTVIKALGNSTSYSQPS